MITYYKSTLCLMGLVLALALPAAAATRIVKQSGGQYGSVVEALTQAQDGDTIEIQDSGTYVGRLNISLNNLTIQAAAGQTPIIDNTTSGAEGGPDACFNFEGTGKLTLKGLIARGGWTVENRNASTGISIQNCVIDCMNEAETIRYDGAGLLEIKQSLIVARGGGAVAWMVGGTVTIENSTIIGIGGVRRMFDAQAAASGTVKDSIFANTDPGFNEWILVLNENVSVTRCDVFNASAEHAGARLYGATVDNETQYLDPNLQNTTAPLGLNSYLLPIGSPFLTASTTGGAIGWSSTAVPAVPFTGRVLTVKKSGGQYSSILDALKAAKSGDTIEIQDSATYSGRMNIYLANIRIRAAEGQTPVIENLSDASFDFQGPGELSLQGLVLRTGWPVVARIAGASINIERCVIKDVNPSTAVSLDQRGTVTINYSLIISAAGGAGVTVGAGGVLNMNRTTVVNAGAAGDVRLVDAENAASGTVTNCILANIDATSPGWVCVGNAGVTLTNTDVFNASTEHPDARVANATEVNTLNVNPAFIATADPVAYGSYALPTGSSLLTASTVGGPIGYYPATEPAPVNAARHWSIY